MRSVSPNTALHRIGNASLRRSCRWRKTHGHRVTRSWLVSKIGTESAPAAIASPIPSATRSWKLSSSGSATVETYIAEPPNTALHRTPAAAPLSPVSSQTLGATKGVLR
jgi:hypothetical protein